MSDFITTTQDAYRSACIATFVTLISAGKGVAERVKDEARGQTAAEYMGVLLLIAVIITAIVGSGMGGEVAKALKSKVQDIANIEKPNCKEPGAC